MQITKQLLFTLLAIILLSASLNAQKRHLRKADAAFNSGEYHAASELYEKAYQRISDRTERTELAYKIGECYRLIDDTRSSRRWYRLAVRGNHGNPLSLLRYAEILLKIEEYEEAKEYFKQYAELVPDDPRGNNGIRSAELIPEWKENPSRYKVEEVRALNSRNDDFSPTYGRLKSEIYFTSNRESATGDNTSEITGKPFADIFEAQQDRTGKWSEPVPVLGDINTPGSEGTPLIISDGSTMYFTACPQQEGANMGCKIFSSRRGVSGWSAPEQIEIIKDSSITVAHPALSKDELTLYFVSDNLPGGKGGKDIWVTTRASKTGQWRQPVNLGSSVNTPGDEMFPFLRDDGVLFFASDGHPGMGGLDIFKAEKQGNSWKVTNMKPPINSPENDFGITFYKNEEEGFFSSSRGRGDNLYSFSLPPLVFTLRGTVVDASNRQPINDAEVTLQGMDGRELKTLSANDGSFRFNLSPNTDYAVIGAKEDFLKAVQNTSTKGYNESRNLEVRIALPPIKSSIELPNIEYDFAKATLRPESKVELDKLVETLNVNDNITIELMANTDFRGDENSNLRLSQARANSVIEYLIEKGIKEDRLVPKGYGESNPKVVNDQMARQYSFLRPGDVLDEEFITNLPDEEQREICHQINRRTEFKVLSTNYGLNTIRFGEEKE